MVMSLERSTMDHVFDLNISAANGDEELKQAFIPREIPGKTIENGSFYLELQEANNIFKAAYKEIMTMAMEAKTWVVAIPALGSLEEFLEMFQSLPPPGMRVERSVESAIVPLDPDILVSYMLDVDRWATLLSPIVYRSFGSVPTGVLQRLNHADEAIEKMLIVNAEFQLPTPFVQTLKFCFLRCLREIIPGIWAIVDVSIDYFPNISDFASEQKCRRRPSGLIIRRRDNYTEVIWIENVEVQDCIYSGMVGSNSVFSAKHWVSTLLWRLKRSESRFINVKMHIDRTAHTPLMTLTDSMKSVYLNIVNEMPDERKWLTIFNQDVRILRNTTADHTYTLGSNSCIAITSLQVQAKPLSVVDFLIKKNPMQRLNFRNLEEFEEVIKLVSDDDSNHITLHRKVDFRNESVKALDYLLQEASSDGFCSYVISTPMTQLDVNAALFSRRFRDDLLQPSGFAVMADGSDGLNSNASLMTIVMQQQLNDMENDQAVEFMKNLISTITREILEGGKFLLKHLL